MVNPRDVVRGELLQAEPDADTERAAEHGEERQVEADRPERDQHADDEQHRAQELRRAARACCCRSPVALASRCSMSPDSQSVTTSVRMHRARALRDGEQRYGRLAEWEHDRVELARYFRQHADEVEDRTGPRSRTRSRARDVLSHADSANRLRIT